MHAAGLVALASCVGYLKRIIIPFNRVLKNFKTPENKLNALELSLVKVVISAASYWSSVEMVRNLWASECWAYKFVHMQQF